MTTDSEKKNIIKSILNLRCRDGATIDDIERDYEDLIGKPLLDAYNYLNTIDCVYCIDDPNGEPKWYAKSNNMQHITELILNQRSAQQTKPKPRPQKTHYYSINQNECFFKDNIVYRHMRNRKPFSYLIEDFNNNNSSCYSQYDFIETPQKPPKTIQHAQLVGDDFFRSVVSAGQIFNRNNGLQQIGLCVSGLSISAAAKLIEFAIYFKSSNLIINVGTVDILHGHSLHDMCQDFDRIIKLCELRDVQPIITTLAPLANRPNSPEMHEKLLKFNEFLWHKYNTNHPIIDIWSQMVTKSINADINSDLFETESCSVSGSNQPHCMWNENGRRIIRNFISSQLNNILKMKPSQRIYFGA